MDQARMFIKRAIFKFIEVCKYVRHALKEKEISFPNCPNIC